MAYTKGDPYIWSDGEKLHLWSVSGNDGWSEIEGYFDNPAASGVAISQAVVDEFAVMRFAEIVKSGELSGVVARALLKWGENVGGLALSQVAKGLLDAMSGLEVA